MDVEMGTVATFPPKRTQFDGLLFQVMDDPKII
jgi:hypothetical protein